MTLLCQYLFFKVLKKYDFIYEIPYEKIYTTSVQEVQNYMYTHEDKKDIEVNINTYSKSYLILIWLLHLDDFDLYLTHGHCNSKQIVFFLFLFI